MRKSCRAIKRTASTNIIILILRLSVRVYYPLWSTYTVRVDTMSTTMNLPRDVTFRRRRRRRRRRHRRAPETSAERGTTANCRVKERRMTETANCFLLRGPTEDIASQPVGCLKDVLFDIIIIIILKVRVYSRPPLPPPRASAVHNNIICFFSHSKILFVVRILLLAIRFTENFDALLVRASNNNCVQSLSPSLGLARIVPAIIRYNIRKFIVIY